MMVAPWCASFEDLSGNEMSGYPRLLSATITEQSFSDFSHYTDFGKEPQNSMYHEALLCHVGGPSPVQVLSYYQGDLQLIRLYNLISFCHKFRHIPCAIDVPSSQPIALLLRQEDKILGRKLGSFNKDFETLA